MTSKATRPDLVPWQSSVYMAMHPAAQVLPYVLLVFGFMLTEVVNPQRGLHLLAVGGLSLLAAAWVFCWLQLRHALVRMGVPYGVFYAGLVPMVAVLAFISGWFGFFTIAGYAYAYRLPWRWRLAGVCAMAVVAATSQTSGALQRHTIGTFVIWFAVFLMNAAAMCSLAWFLRANAVRSDDREIALTELAEANRKLEATLTENAGLHAQLLTQAREAGVVDERRRMAREIHDTLAQGLAGIITQLQAAEQASGDQAGWRHHFAAAQSLARDSLAEARRSVHELRPEPLVTASLGEALASVAGRWQALHGIPVQVTTTGQERPLPGEAEFVLLRAGQEALANVAKHAGASRVGLTLSYMEREVALDIRDDGTGFDVSRLDATPAANGHGFGLVAMRQRVEGLHGTLQVESEPGTGTAVSACVPVTAPAAEAPGKPDPAPDAAPGNPDPAPDRVPV